MDLLYDDVMYYTNHIEVLNKRIAELEAENGSLRGVKSVDALPVVKNEKPRGKPRVAPSIDDAKYEKEAETFVEPVNVVVENTEKVVTVVDTERSKKEYQQEYQRQYRKLKKERRGK